MDRESLERRWLELTRVVLPGMAAAARWPIRNDHCFMRVCLDAVFGGVWHRFIARPAIRSLSDEQLQFAVSIAARIVAEPGCLRALNQQSLDWRRAARA